MAIKRSTKTGAARHREAAPFRFEALPICLLYLASQALAFTAFPLDTASTARVGVSPGPFTRGENVDDATSAAFGSQNRLSTAIRSVSPRHLESGDNGRLQYKDAATQLQDTNGSGRWWNSVFRPAPEKRNDRQQVVDEYLEFLDRRYNRLRAEEKPESKKFTALGWLREHQEEDGLLVSKQQQEDALYALGVAGLASERLLQKHNRLSSQSKKSAQPIRAAQPVRAERQVSRDNVVDVSAVETTMTFSLSETFPVAFRRLEAVWKLVDAYKMKLRLVLFIVLKSLASTPPRAMKRLWRVGGGKTTVSITASAVTCVALLLRPAMQLLSEPTRD